MQAYRVTRRDDKSEYVVVCVYSPAWPVDRARLEGVDVSSVKLTQNPEVWVTDLLVAALRSPTMDRSVPTIVAGDFDLSETFDRWKGGPRGNREWLDRMAALGFTECLRQHQGTLTPTYRRPGKLEPESRIDHLFVTQELAAQLVSYRTGDAQRVLVGESMGERGLPRPR